MYKIYADGQLLHSPYIPELKIQSASLDLIQNDVGTFEFTMQRDHPNINSIQKRKTILEVYRDELRIFRGVAITDALGFRNSRTVLCKEFPYFLTYSVQNPYDFTGGVKAFLELLINQHNSQVNEEHKFEVGTVTVTDPNDYIVRADSTYQNTWEALQKKCLDMLGGYFRFRFESGIQYIDYLADFEEKNQQEVNFGKNLLDLTQEQDTLDIFTVIIPLGADLKDGGELTIEHVNNGKNWLQNDEAVQKYGRIVRTNKWDDVTDAGNLMRKGRDMLNASVFQQNKIELKAVDLGHIEKGIDAFRMGEYIRVVSPKNGIDNYYLPMEMNINLFNLSQNTITLNSSSQSMTDQQIKAENDITAQIESSVQKTRKETAEALKGVATSEEISRQITASEEKLKSEMSATYQTEKQVENLVDGVLTKYSTTDEMNSAIEQSASGLRSEVSDKYTTKEESGKLEVGGLNFLEGSACLDGSGWAIGNYLTTHAGEQLTADSGLDKFIG